MQASKNSHITAKRQLHDRERDTFAYNRVSYGDLRLWNLKARGNGELKAHDTYGTKIVTQGMVQETMQATNDCFNHMVPGVSDDNRIAFKVRPIALHVQLLINYTFNVNAPAVNPGKLQILLTRDKSQHVSNQSNIYALPDAPIAGVEADQLTDPRYVPKRHTILKKIDINTYGRKTVTGNFTPKPQGGHLFVDISLDMRKYPLQVMDSNGISAGSHFGHLLSGALGMCGQSSDTTSDACTFVLFYYGRFYYESE
jgi:hypothetical protein